MSVGSSRTGAIVLLLLLAAPLPARAGGFSNMEFGTKRMGMFAVIARPDDATAMFHNPAGLILTPGTTLFLSSTHWFVEAAIRLYDSQGVLRPDHNIEPEQAWGVSPFLGATTDFGLEDFRFGAALYAPNVFGTSLPADEPTRYQALDALFIAARATATVAWRVSDSLSLGFNANMLGMYLEASRNLNEAVFADSDKRFDPAIADKDSLLEMDGYGYHWSLDLGVLFNITPTLHFGAMFASGAPVDLTGDVYLTDHKGETLHTTHETSLAIPYTLQAGVSWQLVDDFELAADVRYWHYQVLQEQRSVLKERIAGLEEIVDQRNYDNSLNVAVGLRHSFAPGWDFMLGYQRDYSPIPDRTVTLDSPARDRHGVATGIRWQARDDLRVGLAFIRNWYDLTENQESPSLPPNNAKGTGANMALGLDVSWSL